MENLLSIRRISIQNFRSIKKVDINNIGDINVFVGPNEGGKSNILKALSWFSNHRELSDADTPKEIGINEDENIVQIVFLIKHPKKFVNIAKGSIEMNKKLIQFFEKKDAISYHEPKYLRVSKQKSGERDETFFNNKGEKVQVINLDNELDVSKYISDNIISIENQKFFEDGIKTFLNIEGIKNPDPSEKEILELFNHKSMNSAIEENNLNELSTTIYEGLKNVKNLSEVKKLRHDLLSNLNNFENISNYQTYMIRGKEISWSAKQLIDMSIKKFFEKNLCIPKISSGKIEIPKFILYSENMGLKNKVIKKGNWKDSIKQEEYPLYFRLLKLANINPSELDLREGRTCYTFLKNKTRKISKEINERWRQREIKLDPFIDNSELSITIIDLDNQKEEIINTGPEDRSDGFKWFLGYFITLNYIKETNENQILLLDDPALYLHPQGQKDFLKELEILSKKNQIFYSTHLISLFDESHLERIYLVDSENSRTKIKSPWKSNHKDVLEPIRCSLGLDSIIFKDIDRIIFVEGISDKLIFEGILHLLEKNDEWYIYPMCGGDDISDDNDVIKKVKAMRCINSYYDEKSFYFILDGDKKAQFEGEKTKKNLHFLGKETQEMEDLIDKNYYLDCVKEAYYPLYIENKGNITKLQKICDEVAKTDGKLTKILDEKFKKNVLGSFSKTAVSKYIKRELLQKKVGEKDIERLINEIKKIVKN